MSADGVRTTIVLGAGASRSVSYANKGGYPSPLDADFFDLLQRVDASEDDAPAVEAVLEQVKGLTPDHWRSMERTFYTLQLRAYLYKKLTGTPGAISDTEVIANFARCVQCLLRKAHGKEVCSSHQQLFQQLGNADTVITFNYDLVAERALRSIADERKVLFSSGLYGWSKAWRANLPPVLKLHGSSNWRILEGGKISVRTKAWEDLDSKPGYRGHVGQGSEFPIFLPFWDKRIENQPWLSLWKKAYERLLVSDRLIVWGYSLPSTDIKASSLFTLTLASRAIDLCVIDPSHAARERWRRLLPKARYWEYDGIRDFKKEAPSWWEE
jgi:hypothetical protein